MAIYIYFFLNALVFVCCKSINYPWSFILLLLQSPILYCGACVDRLSAQQNDNHCKPMPLSLPEACESVYIFARVCVREHKLQIRSFRYARSAVLTLEWKSGARKTNLFSRIKSAYSLFFFYRFFLLLLLLLWRIFFFSSFVLCSLAGFLRLRLIKVYVYNLDTLSN